MTNDDNISQDGLSEHEEAYIQKFEEAMKIIHPMLEQAYQLVQDATKIADLHGIAFNTNVSLLQNTYCSPDYVTNHLPTFQGDSVQHITDAYGSDYPGWEHSQIC